MLYFDSSFLIPLIRNEPKSAEVQQAVAGLRDRLAVSHWTRVEVTSALGRLVRMGELDLQSANRADARFETMIEDAFTVLAPTMADFELAKNYLKQYALGLRAGDALHLAIATNNTADGIFTFDKTVLAAGPLLGLPIQSGLRG